MMNLLEIYSASSDEYPLPGKTTRLSEKVAEYFDGLGDDVLKEWYGADKRLSTLRRRGFAHGIKEDEELVSGKFVFRIPTSTNNDECHVFCFCCSKTRVSLVSALAVSTSLRQDSCCSRSGAQLSVRRRPIRY